jgi:GT2 family glycosyltransferase
MNSSLAERGAGAAAAEGDSWMVALRSEIARVRGHAAAAAPRDDAALASVVVLNFNGGDVVGRCLDHLGAQTYRRREVIVVDNGSTDGSAALLGERARRGEIRLLGSARNLGVAGGRNLAVRHASGRIVAFLDADAYAAPAWLERLVARIESDDSVGTAASLVFFNRHKLVLNGAGGTLNLRGHGADWCFNVPYELAALPEEVLYPTGCGMAVRRDVLEAMGPHDEAIPYYGYDDVEVGLRTWLGGRRVVLAADAWLDHDGGHAERHQPQKLLLRERGRVRNALKYFPAARLAPWLVHEAQILDHLRSRRTWTIPFLAWSWNLAHLRSALRWRRRFAAGGADLSRLFYASWRGFPWLEPDNRALRPDPAAARPQLTPGDDRAQLIFGWHAPDLDGAQAFRRTAPSAAAVLRTPASAHLALRWRAAGAAVRCEILLRRLGELTPVWRWSGAPPRRWETQRLECPLAAGTYEVQIHTRAAASAAPARGPGVAVAAVQLEPRTG